MRPSSLLRSAEAVSSQDRFLQNIIMSCMKKNAQCEPLPKMDDPIYPVYSNIQERLQLDPNMKKQLSKRFLRIQDFLGHAWPLSFREQLCILCGLSNMDIDTSVPAGSEYKTCTVKQEVVRGLGARFFSLHCMSHTIFSDLQHLSQPPRDLEHSFSMLKDVDNLALRFMKLNSLDKCVVPYRGAQAAGVVENPDSVREAIMARSIVASFHTMIGLLVLKFGSDQVLSGLWPKIFDSSSGILRIITKDLER